MNYGILFSAWGMGGLLLVRVAEMLKVKTGSVSTTFAVAGVLLLVGAMMSLSLRTKKAEVAVEAPDAIGVEEEELVLQKVSQ